MPPAGRDIEQRVEHEAAAVHFGMRQRQAGLGDDQSVIGDQIEIEDARSPFAAAAAAERGLNVVKPGEQVGGREIGSSPQGGIDVAALLRPHRRGDPKGRYRLDVNDLRERVESRPQHRRRRAVAAVPPVGAERDEDGRLHVGGRGLDGAAMLGNPDPPRDCPLCPRLVDYRERLRVEKPDWYNAPVEGWGDPAAWLLVVGLAPGVSGANRTGRPFTGDYAGVLLYDTLAKFGFTRGDYSASAGDGMTLDGVFIANAAACVPPENKPLPVEVHTCRQFLEGRIAALPNLRAIVALGAISHQSTVKALGGKLPKHPFGHGNRHDMRAGVTLFDSYHCSRYNTNTGRLTAGMFEDVFAAASALRP